jgi:hypothetical protein
MNEVTPAPADAQRPPLLVTSTQPVTSNPPAPRKSWFRQHPILTVILVLIVIGVISSAVTKGKGSGSSGVSADNPPAAAATPLTPSPSNSTPPASNMTVPEQQAVESAQSYLAMGSGFSRAGLIQQLSSSAGDGFPRAVAVFAVDHLHVNWDAQAVLSARSYKAMGGFSRAGLIQQLSSSAGEGFTYAQAVYAVNKVGL